MNVRQLMEILKGLPDEADIKGIYESSYGYEEGTVLQTVHLYYTRDGVQVVLKMKALADEGPQVA